MTVLAVDRDPVALTLTIVSEFDAPAARVWQVWADPRQLERWWGPPTFPATVVDHDLTPGGRVTYYMTGPDGEQYHGWWRVIARHGTDHRHRPGRGPGPRGGPDRRAPRRPDQAVIRPPYRGRGIRPSPGTCSPPG